MDKNITALIEQMQLDREASSREREASQKVIKNLLERLTAQNVAQANQPQQAGQAVPAISLHRELSERMEKFVFDAEENKTFEKWHARYQTIFNVDAAAMTSAQKVCLLTEKLSTNDYDNFANTILPQTNATILFEDAVKTLRRIFGRKESTFALRYHCLKVKKEDNESYSEYGARVNLKCEKFDIAKVTPEDFKVLVYVKGLQSQQDSVALAKLLNRLDQQEAREGADDVNKITLQEAVNLSNRLKELNSERNMVTTEATNAAVFSAVHQKKGGSKHGERHNYPSKKKEPSRPCWLCSDNHWVADCPFQNKKCFDCNEIGHKKGHCSVAKYMALGREKKRNSSRRQSLEVSANVVTTRKFVEPSIEGKKIRLLLDSGSDWTIISMENWRHLGSPSLTKCEEQAVSASGGVLEILGKFDARLKLHKREGTGACYVAKTELNLLGSDWMESLDLWNIPISKVCHKIDTSSLENEVMSKFPKLFTAGLGKCNRMKASLTLKPGTKPIFRKKRPVPFAAAHEIEKELKRLQLLEVLTPISYSQYAAPLVVVKKKDGRLRICADYSTGLNDALESNQYPLPTPEEIFAKLSRYTVFSNIDLSDAFLQIELDDEAKEKMVINTHCGLFQVNRMQPGVKTAPGSFQQLTETMMAGAEGVSTYMDDFIIGGIDDEDHRKNLFEALRRIEDYGFRLQIGKCKFGQKQIEFLGHVIDIDGIRPAPNKLETLTKLPAPKNLQQLQAFLGAVTWYSKFIPGLKDLRGPLDQLLCKDEEFKWDQNQQNVFNKLKEIFSSDLAITHFDPKKKIIVAADASSYGMGAVLLHEMPDGSKRPVIHAASSFTKAEKNYPQVQREALALTFAVKKFHRYIFGRRFELQTDHQPLLSIFGSKSGIPVYTASRLQRYALTLLAYDFKIRYVDTKSFAYADFVSRLIANHEKNDEDVVIATSLRGTVNVKNNNAPWRLSDMASVKKNGNDAPGDVRTQASLKNEKAPFPNVFHTDGIRSPVTVDGCSSCFAIESAKTLPITFEALKAETNIDVTMGKLAKFVENGWPRQQKQIQDENVAKFFVHRDSIICIKGCLFLGDRIIIPVRYRTTILKTMHDGHPGTARMKLLARSKVYWPGIDNDIEKMVKCCEECSTNAKTPIKCSLMSWPASTKPWSRVHIDYAGPVNNFSYLVVVDAFSNWPEIFKLTTTTAQKTIECLEDAFSRHGLCDTLVSDNGVQFASSTFADFCRKHGVEHIRTAPYHPQSNGLAERMVGIFKTGLKKLEEEGNIDHILRKFLMCYRYTPSHALGGKSPFQIMTGRVMKTQLDLLKPPTEQEFVRNDLMEQQFNVHHGAKWKEFSVGEEVFIKTYANNAWKWTPGTVTERNGAVNYTVEVHGTQDNRKIKSHANQMKRRYNFIDASDNPFLDELIFSPLMHREVEPQFIPQENSDEEGEDDVFRDAEENEPDVQQAVPEVPQAELPNVQTPRRSTRTTAGVPPRWFPGYDAQR